MGSGFATLLVFVKKSNLDNVICLFAFFVFLELRPWLERIEPRSTSSKKKSARRP
jgi:hypothetical protein